MGKLLIYNPKTVKIISKKTKKILIVGDRRYIDDSVITPVQKIAEELDIEYYPCLVDLNQRIYLTLFRFYDDYVICFENSLFGN